ncbi:hypothetical protein C8J56DRAFT_940669 [Mycena floridula]|nr:hypothetical protein C8J56DRAFT_940669 [Mycena floridula]
MLKFEFRNYARRVLRPSFAQHVRSFSSPISQTGSASIFLHTGGSRDFIDPTTVRDQFKSFGDIVNIWSARSNGTSVTFASPEQAQKLLDTATDGQVTTESGKIYRIKPTSSSVPPNPASKSLQVMTFEQNVKEADVQEAFSTFGAVEKVNLERECPAMGKLAYSAHFVVQFTNINDAVKAHSTLVSLSTGALLQTKYAPINSPDPTTVLQFLLERPWGRIQPDYNSKLFVEDLARLADVPREDLNYVVDRRISASGLMKLFLQTKTVEAAQKIMAIQSAEIPNAEFFVKYHPGDKLPLLKKRKSSKAKATEMETESEETK